MIVATIWGHVLSLLGVLAMALLAVLIMAVILVMLVCAALVIGGAVSTWREYKEKRRQ